MEFESDEFPGWVDDGHSNMRLCISIAGTEVRLATVTYDAENGLYETYIGLVSSSHQRGRIDASRERAVRKAEEYLLEKLQRLL